ncbi:glycoside hydrolase family 76 protein [Xylaria sp. FL0933]|nr:glycoside hydrolase family 76 protein [Xylaria sp. FL0933]
MMKLPVRLVLLVGGFVTTLQTVAALGPGDPDAVYQAFNNAFLTTSGNSAFYKSSLSDSSPDGTWSGSLDILGAEDAFDRTGDPATQTLINNLLTTWLQNTPPPWSWDGWNDDIGWFTLALIRGYQITGNQEFLTQARYGFDYAFGRGWDTQYNGGGIWEQNEGYTTDLSKCALSNDSLGKVACLIYQSTHNQTYLTQCRQIYDWVWNHLYDYTTGQVNACVAPDGTVDHGTAAYSQGTFIDYANLLWKITGDQNVKNDAQRALDFAKNQLTQNGIFSSTITADYFHTWADEVARGAGNFIRDNQLWDTYYSWMVQNADAILANRRSDLGITWNGWATPTPQDNTLITNQFVSAVAWLQYTPVNKPNNIAGIHIITNQDTGLAIDSGGTFGNGNSVIQWGPNGGKSQQWQLTQNSDTSWNIVSLDTWQALDCPGGSNEQNLAMVQWHPNRGSNQRWWIDQQSDGSYKIWNQQSSLALDGASSTNNGAPLVQWGWNGGSQQRWILH